MTLTNGQTYFFILCVTALVAFVANWLFTIVKIHIVNGSIPCSGLSKLQKEVSDVRRLAMAAYQKTHCSGEK